MSTLKDFKKILSIKRYSKNTIDAYCGLLIAFKKHIDYQEPLNSLSNIEIAENFKNVILENNYAQSTQNQLNSALKLFFRIMHNRDVELKFLETRKAQRQLPIILSKKDVKRLLDSTINIKHHAMLSTVYALGLRSGELCNLKLVDLDGNRNQVRIVAAKGRKDRVMPFPKKLKNILRNYYKEYRPKTFLFEGRANSKYSTTSLRAVFNKSKNRAKINPKITLHGLRHAYATHLLDQGLDIRIIKELLGHNSIKTTLIYTHVTNTTLLNVPSPLDTL